jgi:lipopolysaccharide biosynthesis regulator YciM
MSGWPGAVYAAAERLAREHLDGPEARSRLAPAAVRLGLREEAGRLAQEDEEAGEKFLGIAAKTYAALGDRAPVDRLRARAKLNPASDPMGLTARTFAAAYQRLGDDAEADRLVGALEDTGTRWAALAVLIHAAVETRRPQRAAALARAVAAVELPAGEELTAVLALAAGGTDPTTAATVAPVAERAAATLGPESRDEAMVLVARLWVTAGEVDRALRIALPMAKRASPDFNAGWYADLARVLIDAGDAAAGNAVFERHIQWYEQERSAAATARAALALARWGRPDDAEYLLANRAEPQLEELRSAVLATSARRVLVDAYLALNDVAPALHAASELSDPDDKARALLAIAVHGHEHGVDLPPDIDVGSL